MAQMMIMGQPAKKAVTFVLITGGVATVSKFAGDSLGEKLFKQTDAEAASSPRTVNEQKMIQLYRGGVIMAAGLLFGKVAYKYSKPVAIGVATGFTVSGMDRILTVYDVKRQIKNLFLDDANQIARPADNTITSYGVMFSLPAGRTMSGRTVATREVVPLRMQG